MNPRIVAGGAPATGSPNRRALAARCGLLGAHLSRRFHELRVSGVSHAATETIERMTRLRAIEEKKASAVNIRFHEAWDGRVLARTALSSAVTESRHALTE